MQEKRDDKVAPTIPPEEAADLLLDKQKALEVWRNRHVFTDENMLGTLVVSTTAGLLGQGLQASRSFQRKQGGTVRWETLSGFKMLWKNMTYYNNAAKALLKDKIEQAQALGKEAGNDVSESKSDSLSETAAWHCALGKQALQVKSEIDVAGHLRCLKFALPKFWQFGCYMLLL